MNVKCTFKNIDWSQSLADYTAERFEKVKKLELKPVNVSVTFSAQGHLKCAQVHVDVLNKHYQAKAQSDDYYVALDLVFHKIVNQMNKHRKRVQNHKNFDRSAQGRMERTSSQLEADYIDNNFEEAS